MEALLGAIERQARSKPDSIAVIGQAMRMTYGELWESVSQLEARFAAESVSAGALLIAPALDPRISCAAFLASMRVGAAWSVSELAPDETAWLRPSHTLTVEGSDLQSLQIEQAQANPLIPVGTTSAPDTAIVTPTRTAGTLVGMAISRQAMAARANALQTSGDTRPERLVLRFSSHTLPYWVYLLAALSMSGSVRLDGDPPSWLADKVDRVAGPLPVISRLIAGRVGGSRKRLPRLDLQQPTLSPQAAGQLLDHFKLVHLEFGTTGTGTLWSSSFARNGDGNRIAPAAQSVGIKVEIIDATGESVATGSPGILRAEGDTLASSFLLPGGKKASIGHGVALNTGLIARQTQNGGFEVLGQSRLHHVVSGDTAIPIAVVDAAIGSTLGIDEHVSFPHPDAELGKLITFVIFSQHVNRIQAVERVKKSVRDTLGADFEPGRVWPVDDIPRHPDGQADILACQQAVRQAIEAKSAS